MKIIHLIESLSRGGAEIFACELACSQKKMGHDIVLVSLFRSQDSAFEKKKSDELSANGIETHILNFRGSRIKGTLRIRQLLIDLKPAVINTHLQTVTVYAAAANLFSGIPLVQTFHSINTGYRVLQKVVFSFILNGLISVSDDIDSVLKEKFNIRHPVSAVIYNGIDTERIAGRQKRENNTVRCIAVGNLTEPKNYSMLIDVYRKMKESEMNMPHCSIVGDGPLRNEIETAIKQNGLDRYISLLGYRDDVPELLSRSDIFIMTSAWEGLSIALIEAVSTGLPAVVTDVGSNHLLVHDKRNGFLIEPQSSEEFIRHLNQLVTDAELREKMSRESLRISRQFDIDNTSANYIKFYEKVLDR
ncbi:MAG: glycosyltransferase family 4 protein [bacterium]